MAEILKVVPSRATERQRVAEEVAELATEVLPRDGAIAMVLERLAESVRQGRHDEAKGYAAAIDPRATAETITGQRSAIWGFLDVARNVLVFAPIAVTWYGLATATDAYAKLLSQQPDLMGRPFLLLWQESFHGVGGVMSFSTIATIDAALIGLLIVLSLVIHVRADVRDASTRAAAMVKESQIRATLAHATGMASSGFGSDQADEILDQMAAEERRVFERAVEREQQLYDLEGAIGELRASAAALTEAARIMTQAPDRKPAARRPKADPAHEDRPTDDRPE